MRIAIIADAFPPMRTSAAVQLRDLAQELLRQGHVPTMLLPSSDINRPWMHEEIHGVWVLRLKSPQTKDVSYVRRTIGEFLMPFFMMHNLKKSPYGNVKWDGVVWYAPTIFLGPIAKALKSTSSCRSYLIIRDIFPEWAVNMGMLGRGLPYRFFKAIERYQYSVADIIGVQTAGELNYFASWASRPSRRLEVLQNWLSEAPNVGCSISVADSSLAGRVIFVYAGNMGVARGMEVLLDLVERLQARSDVGFLFVGRGSEVAHLRADAKARKLDNILFYDEVDPSEIPGLYSQCHVGIVALDPRHKTQNIPGKFLTYMQAGLPVLASINPGNDLIELIEDAGVGRVCTDCSVDTLERLVNELVIEVIGSNVFYSRCMELSNRLYAPSVAVKKIVNSLADLG